MWKWLLCLAVATACGFPRPADVKDQSIVVNGNVHGMWTGANGVTLRLTSDGGVDLMYSLHADGPFVFPSMLREGASYIVVIAENPAMHSCTVTAGASGIAPAEGAVLVDVACQGPAASIALSAPAPWTFDPTVDVQPPLEASVLLQDVTLTVSSADGSVTSARIAGMPATLGKPSAPQPLPLGMSSFDVDLAAAGGLTMKYKVVIDRGGAAIDQSAYGKASNTGRHDSFGQSVAVSGDILVVGAPGESSRATGVNGNQMDDSAPNAGAVYVFRRVGSTWTHEAYLKESDTAMGDRFGTSVAIAGDTIAVGAPGEVPGGAVYVFRQSGTTWTQEAVVIASNADPGDFFGSAVALSGDTLAVGALAEDSRAAGVNMDQIDNSAPSAGAAYIFTRIANSSGTFWLQQAYLKASNAEAGDEFGGAISLSGDTLVVGASAEASNATGINGDQLNNFAPVCGAVYVFQREGGQWTQQAYVKALNVTGLGQFGSAIVLSGDTLIVAAKSEFSSATGINGQSDSNAADAGAVYVFQRSNRTWSQQAFIKASNTQAGDGFGSSVAFSHETLVVGAIQEDSAAVGLDGVQADNNSSESGAVYVFQRAGTTWSQKAYIKASNGEVNDHFGSAVAVADDTVVVAALGEDGGETGINRNQADNRAEDAGAVYVFR